MSAKIVSISVDSQTSIYYFLAGRRGRTYCSNMIWNKFIEVFFSCTSLTYLSRFVKKTRSIISSTSSGCAQTSTMVSSGLSGTGLKL
jgi:hypothetical protein